jgi:hypothetical protein
MDEDSAITTDTLLMNRRFHANHRTRLDGTTTSVMSTIQPRRSCCHGAKLARTRPRTSMNRSATFGVIGGSGSTAKAVAKELHRSTDKPFLIGGRNLANAEAVAANLGVTVSAVRVDIRDARSLEDFCGSSSVVLNCGGRFTSYRIW